MEGSAGAGAAAVACAASVVCAGAVVVGAVVVGGVAYVVYKNSSSSGGSGSSTGSNNPPDTYGTPPGGPDDWDDMLGSNGTQVSSKTLWKKDGARIDVENSNPGQRPGQIHYQDGSGNKYIYDVSTNTFRGAPKSVNNLLRDPSFKNGIEKGLRYLGVK
jgi:filamentous hemagglutinin